MKILFITNMYPTKDHIYQGIHVKEQIEYLSQTQIFDHEIYIINGKASKLNYLKSIFQINKLICSKEIDILHIHFGLSGLFMLFNPFIKTPSVLTLHGSDITKPGLMQTITRIVARKVNRIIILNDKMRILLNTSLNNLYKIPCGINIDQFSLNRKNGATSDFIIGFPGDKNRPEKNYKLFKKIIIKLAEAHKNIKIIEFHNLTRAQVIEKLSTLDCLLMTSIREGSPQIIKEAMASGVPVISTNVGDVSNLLDSVEYCWVIDSFEPEQFTDKLAQLFLLRPEQRLTNGRSKIIDLKLDQASVTKRIYAIYENILSDNEKAS
ncbi:glycosyltransferase family 4 protein [Solitalea sp. MAHUQ-68]|uniref:Glycosyltransferase family 4 protein n=1 Tax=Solitalea agri TaxID=2953739 RepID=A0A9X2JFQ4_9SPHI|nr:glycosyltransferase family 4 protein [Solitalea agri]MCO4293681.1 glycosyltransferase family 4 protein [Solitalea agri]